MNMNSGINASSSIVLISIYLRHTATGEYSYKLDLRHMDEARFKLDCLKEYVRGLAELGIGTAIQNVNVSPLVDGSGYKMTVFAGNLYSRDSTLADDIRLLRTPGYQEVDTFIYDEDANPVRGLEIFELGDGHKQTRAIKVQGHNWISEGRRMVDMTSDDWEDLFFDEDGYAQSPHHVL